MKISGGGGVAGTLGWPLLWYSKPAIGTLGAGDFANPINTYNLFGFFLPAQVRFNKLYIQVSTADAAHLYSVGVYDTNGTLQGSSTPAGVTGTGTQAFTMAGGPVTLNPGRYYLSFTGNSLLAQFTFLNASTYQTSFFNGGGLGSTSGGALNPTITPPADSLYQAADFAFSMGI